MYKKILVPTDGSEAAEKEVEKVGDLLAEDGEIIILSVASELTPHQFQSKEDIDKLTIKEVQAVIFDLTDDLGKKDITQALQVLQNLIYAKEPLPKILVTLYNNFK